MVAKKDAKSSKYWLFSYTNTLLYRMRNRNIIVLYMRSGQFPGNYLSAPMQAFCAYLVLWECSRMSAPLSIVSKLYVLMDR